MSEDRYNLTPVGRLQDDKTPPRTLDQALADRGMTRDDLARKCRIEPDWKGLSSLLAIRRAQGIAAGHALAESLEEAFSDGMFFDGMSSPPEHLGRWDGRRFVPEIEAPTPPDTVSLSPADYDRLRAALIDGTVEHVIQVPPPWRWYRDPAVIGAILGALAIIAAAYWMAGP